ncbi:MAG: PaaI family thioesterase [Desulfuromonas sp.]|nr:MAG: PaaI family thioesterase [Desulfuromonas sp.]
MQLSADRKCFVCGPDNESGLNIRFTIDPVKNRAEATTSLAESFQGWQGVVHGGIISALLDEAAIYACRPQSLHAVTMKMLVRFRKPVQVDQEVKVSAEVVSVRRNLAEVKSVLTAGGDLLAEAEIKVMLLGDEEK